MKYIVAEQPNYVSTGRIEIEYREDEKVKRQFVAGTKTKEQAELFVRAVNFYLEKNKHE
jgi:hypothetical protein